MYEVIEPPVEGQPGEELSWHKVWISVITRPSTQTFEWILRDPQAGARRAYIWLVVTAVISAIISLIVGGMVNGAYSLLGITRADQAIQSTIISMLCAPAGILVQILGVTVGAWIAQWIAGRFFGGSGTFTKMIYALAAIMAPATLINSLLAGIPVVNCLAIPFAIYLLVLTVMAVMAVNKVGWWQAVVSYYALPVLFGIFIGVLTICVLTLLGPAINDTFQNIIRDIGGVTP